MVQNITTEDAITFLRKYTDPEVYTDKCIEAHKMAIAALEIMAAMELKTGKNFQEAWEESWEPVPYEFQCANPHTEEELQALNREIRTI